VIFPVRIRQIAPDIYYRFMKIENFDIMRAMRILHFSFCCIAHIFRSSKENEETTRNRPEQISGDQNV